MTPGPVACSSVAKDGAPRHTLESFCGIPMSAHFTGVGLLIAFLSMLGCLVWAPGMAIYYYLSVLSPTSSLELTFKF